MPSWKVTNRASITNRPAWTVGGLGPSVGPGAWATRAIQINANGQGPFRFRTFCINQLGNIGGGVRNSMFGPSSDGTNGCRDQPCIAPPYCASAVWRSLASSQHTLTVGSGNPGSATLFGFATTPYIPAVNGFGSLTNQIFNGLPIFAAVLAPPGGVEGYQYVIIFPAAGFNQLQSMNISLEVTNNQESASTTASASLSPGLLNNGGTGTLLVSNSLNSTFINIVNTVGSTYTLKIKENP